VKEILEDIDRWKKAEKKIALARVVKVEGSGPRDPGATMAVNEDGEVAGSVSGGCVRRVCRRSCCNGSTRHSFIRGEKGSYIWLQR